jgi:hypothetical protein
MRSAACIDHLGLEIGRTYALLFLQEPTAVSRHEAKRLGLDLENFSLGGGVRAVEFRNIFYDSLLLGNIPRLEDFQLMRRRLYELQKQMNDWRPQGVRDLFKKGYKDPLTWYGFIFAISFGLIGILGLAVAIVQTAATFNP